MTGLGLKIVPPVAKKPDPIRDFETGDHGRVVSEFIHDEQLVSAEDFAAIEKMIDAQPVPTTGRMLAGDFALKRTVGMQPALGVDYGRDLGDAFVYGVLGCTHKEVAGLKEHAANVVRPRLHAYQNKLLDELAGLTLSKACESRGWPTPPSATKAATTKEDITRLFNEARKAGCKISWVQLQVAVGKPAGTEPTQLHLETAREYLEARIKLAK